MLDKRLFSRFVGATIVLAALSLACRDARTAHELVYIALAQPCRVVETRGAYNPTATGVMLESATTYTYGVDDASIRMQTGEPAASCGIPADATAIGANLLLLDASDSGNVKAWANDPNIPPAASIAVFNATVSGQAFFNGAFANIPLSPHFFLRPGHARINLVIDVLGFWRSVATSVSNGQNNNSSVALGDGTSAAGILSTALGFDSEALGSYATALGFGTQAGGAATFQPSTAVGELTVAQGDYSTALGYATKADGIAATSMSNGSEASGNYATAVGLGSTASGVGAAALGLYAVASGDYAIAFGDENAASGKSSTAIGFSTVAAGEGSVAMGYNTSASGKYSIALGYGTTASSPNALAMGNDASASATGTFVYGDGSAKTLSGTTGRFAARASGGFIFLSSKGTSGVSLAANGGSWSSLSDRNAKDSAIPIDAPNILARVASLPLSTWHYKAQDKQYRHMGPMAQDFRAAFGLGENEVAISVVDADGVALASIQGLAARMREESSMLSTLRTQAGKETAREDAEFEQLQSALATQSAHLDALDAMGASRRP